MPEVSGSEPTLEQAAQPLNPLPTPVLSPVASENMWTPWIQPQVFLWPLSGECHSLRKTFCVLCKSDNLRSLEDVDEN